MTAVQLLLPRRVIREWRGILLREPRSPDAMIDYVDEDGGEWFLHDGDPRTDYARLRALDGAQLLTIGDATALAVGDGTVITEADNSADALEWETLFELDVRDERWVLMNASIAGVQVLGDADDEEWTHVTLQRGQYRVERAARDGGSAYRLNRLGE